VVWTLTLQSESEGPTLISCAARLLGSYSVHEHSFAPSWRTVIGIPHNDHVAFGFPSIVATTLINLGLAPDAGAAPQSEAETLKPTFGIVEIGAGIALHYVEEGSGTPVVFVHGSLSHYEYWNAQLEAFSKQYRAIAYSRHYNYRNSNPDRPEYSAVTDSEDLASLIAKLNLGKVYVVGHSYGALTALFLATKHAELIRGVVLAEPPAVSLLRHLPDEDASKGEAMFADIQHRMVGPMKAHFAQGDSEAGVGASLTMYSMTRAPGSECLSLSAPPRCATPMSGM